MEYLLCVQDSYLLLHYTVFFNSFFGLILRNAPNLSITDPLRGESTGDRWIPITNGQWWGKRLHAMTSSFHIKPQQLNWTPRPFRGDVQVAWRYTFESQNPPAGLLTQMLTTVTRATTDCAYKYVWRDGALIRIGEVCMYFSMLRAYFVRY